MNPAEALDWLERNGAALASATGALPSVAAAVAGEQVKGSWWGHPKGKQIFRILESLGDSQSVLVCRLAGGKLTLVHRRLWPALVRLKDLFEARQLSRVRQEHTSLGHHVNVETRFPAWVPTEVIVEARALSEGRAREMLGSLLEVAARPKKIVKRRRAARPR